MTENKTRFMVALFRSVHHVLASEKILIRAEIPHKIIPVPKIISSECGVCIRFLPEYKDNIEELLKNSEILEIRML